MLRGPDQCESLLAITLQDGLVFHAAVVTAAPKTAPAVGAFRKQGVRGFRLFPVGEKSSFGFTRPA